MGDSYVVKGAKLKYSCGDGECSLQTNNYDVKTKGKDQVNKIKPKIETFEVALAEYSIKNKVESAR